MKETQDNTTRKVVSKLGSNMEVLLALYRYNIIWCSVSANCYCYNNHYNKHYVFYVEKSTDARWCTVRSSVKYWVGKFSTYLIHCVFNAVYILLWFLCRDLSVDAGLPPHQYHIHPLPQHYQHYLTSPRMHHFPRNNASTQVVSPSQRNQSWRVFILTNSQWISSGLLILISTPSGSAKQQGKGLYPCFSYFHCRADVSFFYLSSPRLSMRSETTHIPSCTCWLCRVSTPPATHLLLERATRFVLAPALLPPSRHQIHQSTLIYHCCSVTNALDRLECVTDLLISNYSGLQMPQMVQMPLISWQLFSS